MSKRALQPAGKRSPALARLALQVLVAAVPLAPRVAHGDASVPGKGDKPTAKPGEAPKPKPPVEEPHFTGGVIAQPAPPLPPPTPKKKEK
jgi:hypothetical protein